MATFLLLPDSPMVRKSRKSQMKSSTNTSSKHSQYIYDIQRKCIDHFYGSRQTGPLFSIHILFIQEKGYGKLGYKLSHPDRSRNSFEIHFYWGRKYEKSWYNLCHLLLSERQLHLVQFSAVILRSCRDYFKILNVLHLLFTLLHKSVHIGEKTFLVDP